MFLFWALKDQSGELQRLSNEAPSRLGVWIVSLCRFIGFRRWTHQIFHKIDTCSKKDFNRLNQNFSSKTSFFFWVRIGIGKNFLGGWTSRCFAAQVLAERKELELQSGMSDVKVFSKIGGSDPIF